jgi:hypothetical protein
VHLRPRRLHPTCLRALKKLIIAGVIAFAILQFARPGIPEKPAAAEIHAPPEIRGILDKSCYSCHSDQRRLLWFDQVVPAYWLVRHDILKAREHLNFSTVGATPAAAQQAKLYEAVNMIQFGAMPLPAFLKLHPDAKVTPEELATLKNYLAPWTPTPPANGASAEQAAPFNATGLNNVPAEFNGLPLDPSFETWELLSTTDRGDNNTFRFILGNVVAMKAARAGSVSPWPDGTRFAKIAWQEESGPDGLIHPGKFVQVELMVKDAARYKSTEGWGWGRWRGLDLKPYGSDASFVNECTGCHLPMRENDYVYSLPVTPATVSRTDVVNNAAALPANLPYRPLDWRALTMYVDPQTRTMATLYGNDAAIARLNAPSYPQGAVLALVSWAQRDDPHWFGARIPGAPQSVEFVQVSAAGTSYRRFAGTGLAEDLGAASEGSQRANFILGLGPARLP